MNATSPLPHRHTHIFSFSMDAFSLEDHLQKNTNLCFEPLQPVP